MAVHTLGMERWRGAVARRMISVSLVVGLIVAMWRKRKDLVPALQQRLEGSWLQPYMQPLLKRLRDRIARDKFQELRRKVKAGRMSSGRAVPSGSDAAMDLPVGGGRRGTADPAAQWHAGLEEPRYEWRQIISWRVLGWLVARARQCLTSYVDGRLHVDELDMEKLSLRKR